VRLVASPLGPLDHNTSVAHDAHDATARCNDGLCFLWLDRWMGALDPGYNRGFDAATPRRAPRTP